MAEGVSACIQSGLCLVSVKCVFHFIAIQFYDVCKWPSTLWPHGRICMFAHYTTSLSLCRRIWRYWMSKIFVKYIMSSVCLILSQFSQSFSCNIWARVYAVYQFILWWLWEKSVLYLNTIIKSKSWPICHCLCLGHRTMGCAVCLSIFLFQIYTILSISNNGYAMRTVSVNFTSLYENIHLQIKGTTNPMHRLKKLISHVYPN